jgi:hypothetical protein
MELGAKGPAYVVQRWQKAPDMAMPPSTAALAIPSPASMSFYSVIAGTNQILPHKAYTSLPSTVLRLFAMAEV